VGKLIRIIAGGVELEAELSDTECAGAIYEALPIETAFNTWGEEFYFEIPVSRELDDTATTSVKVGDIGYWPPAAHRQAPETTRSRRARSTWWAASRAMRSSSRTPKALTG
jgi:hypothetical protein